MSLTLLRAAAVLDAISDVIAWLGRAACWLLLPIILAVLVSVVGGLLGLTRFAAWEDEVFLFGDAITLNSVLELQWYLFGVLLMMTGAYALAVDRHVRVDVVSSRFSPRGARIAEIVGDLVFLIPLCVILFDRALPLVELSYNTGERSNEDGLTHRWVVKAFVPVGFALLGTLGVVRVLRNVLVLLGVPERPRPQEVAGPHGG